MAKLMAPNIRIDWYPEGHFADIQNPTVEELNSGYNLSCAIVTGYTLDFTDSNTEDTTTIFDDFTSESILNHSYEADLQFFLAPRDSIAGNEEAYRKAEELFYVDQNPKGYLAKRFGFPGDSKYVGNQKVDLFLLQADLPKVLSEEDNPVLLNIRFLPQGEAVSGVTVVGQLVKVTAVEPTWKDSPNLYLKGGGTWSTPAVEGVIYARPSGTAKGGETVTVSARPKTGYEITGSTSWSHTFPEKLPWVSYEWEGEPHNSPSIKRDHTGQIVARNVANDPRMTTAAGWGWTSSTSPTFGAWDDSCGAEIRAAASGASTRVGVYSSEFSGDPGRWIVSLDVQRDFLVGTIRVTLFDTSSAQGESAELSVVPVSRERVAVVLDSPRSWDRVYLDFRENTGVQPGGLVGWFDRLFVGQVESDYFDGDTPDEYL